jgi:Protein of unknown function (DUF1326)
MLRRMLGIVAVGVAALLLVASPVSAARASQGLTPSLGGISGGDYVEARQFKLADAPVAGHESIKQSVTAWEVTSGSWNGESLEGLSLVLVQNKPENGEVAPTTNCYISHAATAAQRNALLSAFVASQDVKNTEVMSWRIEAAVIRIEVAGKQVIVHLGLVA